MFELSFAPEFFIGPYDLDGTPEDPERPTSVFQALAAMDEDEWEVLATDVFGTESLEIDTVLEKIRETDTCSNLNSPVEVWIDPEGWFRVLVYDRA